MSASEAHEPARLIWDPEQYARFRDERARPFHDLLARVPGGPVRTAADLGCGTGELTRTLVARWPGARVWGIDSSAEMLRRARQTGDPKNPEFAEADLRFWSPPVPLDRIVSNAALHWVPNHGRVLEGLASLLAPGGVLAVQMPANREETAYRVLLELLAEIRWSARLGRGAISPPIEAPSWYAGHLHRLGLESEVWETIYYHPLGAPTEIVEWMKGSVLRPVLAVLAPGDAAEFLEDFGIRVAAAYPPSSSGVLFPFRRLFFVARRG